MCGVAGVKEEPLVAGHRAEYRMSGDGAVMRYQPSKSVAESFGRGVQVSTRLRGLGGMRKPLTLGEGLGPREASSVWIDAGRSARATTNRLQFCPLERGRARLPDNFGRRHLIACQAAGGRRVRADRIRVQRRFPARVVTARQQRRDCCARAVAASSADSSAGRSGSGIQDDLRADLVFS